MASGLVLTRIGGAFVHVDLTLVATEAINAQAFESICFIQTSTAIQTRFLSTVINVDQAVTTFKSITASHPITIVNEWEDDHQSKQRF